MGDAKSLLLEFSKKYDISFPIYIDMSRASYELFEFPVQLGIGISTILRPNNTLIRAFDKGQHRDPYYNKVEKILFDNGEIAFKNIAQKAGEHRDLEEILSGL